MENNTNSKAIASLVLGILGIVGGFIPYISFIAWILSIIAIVLAVKARNECTQQGQSSGMATAGLVLGIVSLGLAVLGLLCIICATAGIASLGALY